ncbi:MAG: hypothetical protein H7Y06_12510 [Opitutaceae bacterium]|nr:hypothetical protein [Opitutaceae bacterium]
MPSAGPTDTAEASRPPVFIDRNSGGRLFKGLIEAAGIRVVLHDEQFKHKTEDPDWLAKVGKSGWLLVSGDNATTSQPLFLFQLEATRAHVFILLGLNGASAENKAACVINAYSKMCELAASEEPPAIWRIGKDGVARRFDFRKTLERMRRGRRL